MKVSAILAAALTTAQAVYAVDVQKSVIVTYDEGTPDNIVRQAMDAIKSAGGIVTHEYKFIKYVSNLLYSRPSIARPPLSQLKKKKKLNLLVWSRPYSMMID